MIDIFFAILMLVAIFKGYQKGLIVAVFSIIAFIVGIVAALKLSSLVAEWLGNHANISVKWLPFLSFAIVFFVVVLLVRWGAKIVEKTFKIALLGWVNRLGGILFYAILYTLFYSIFLFYAEKIHLVEQPSIQSSVTYNFVQPWAPVLINNIATVIPIFKGMFTQLETFFETVGNKIRQ